MSNRRWLLCGGGSVDILSCDATILFGTGDNYYGQLGLGDKEDFKELFKDEIMTFRNDELLENIIEMCDIKTLTEALKQTNEQIYKRC
jgi:hypothetical protein